MMVWSPVGAVREAAKIGVDMKEAVMYVAFFSRRLGKKADFRAAEKILRDKLILERAGVSTEGGVPKINKDLEIKNLVYISDTEIFKVAAFRHIRVDNSTSQKVLASLYDQPHDWLYAKIEERVFDI